MTAVPTLYWISGGPPSLRVMMGLADKGIPHRSVVLDASCQDQKSSDYLYLNPRGQVPTLVHGEVRVRECLAILAYLDAAFPAAPLFGETPALTAAIWQAAMEIDGVLRTPAGLIARGLFRGTADAQAPGMVDAAAEVTAELDRIEAELADGRTWLCARGITAADVVLSPTLAWLARALGHAEPESFSALRGERPWLEAWRARIEAQEWFHGTYPPHWR